MSDLRCIALYLPQYHTIPENDEWWGAGFTDWTNVRPARPRFSGHYQPHIPAGHNYYDLRDPSTREYQAELARDHGVHGFCYYHYWFNGHRLLQDPFESVLNSKKPDFPFCLCWANENWTRRWDGKSREILIKQEYSDEDSHSFARSLIPALRDERYIRVNGRPILLVYRTSKLKDPGRTTSIWREEVRRAGIGELYLVRVENDLDGVEPAPAETGFDAAVEFAPRWRMAGPGIASRVAVVPESQSDDLRVFDYRHMVLSMLGRTPPAYPLFRGVFPMWDNSPRKKRAPTIFVNSTPELYAIWLSQIARYTYEYLQGEERLVFVNAWNEWGEGCHLEPDERFGTKYLEATKFALQLAADTYRVYSKIGSSTSTSGVDEEKWYQSLKAVYDERDMIAPSQESLVSAFGLYAQSGMIPLLARNVRRQFESVVEEKQQIIDGLLSSKSWRVTSPLRKLYGLLKR